MRSSVKFSPFFRRQHACQLFFWRMRLFALQPQISECRGAGRVLAFSSGSVISSNSLVLESSLVEQLLSFKQSTKNATMPGQTLPFEDGDAPQLMGVPDKSVGSTASSNSH